MWTPNPIKLQKKEKTNVFITNQLTIEVQNFIQNSDNTWDPNSEAIVKQNLEIIQTKLYEINSRKIFLERCNISINMIIPLVDGIGIAINCLDSLKIPNICIFCIAFFLHCIWLILKLSARVIIYSEVCLNLSNLCRSIECELLKETSERIDPNLLMLNMESHYTKIIKKIETL